MSGRSPVRSPGRLKEEDAAAHAARVKEARAAYSRLCSLLPLTSGLSGFSELREEQEYQLATWPRPPGLA